MPVNRFKHHFGARQATLRIATSLRIFNGLVVPRPRHRRLDPLEAYATLGLRFARVRLGDKLLDGIKDSGKLFVIPFLESFNLASEVAVRIHQPP